MNLKENYPQLIEDTVHPLLELHGLIRPEKIYPDLAKKNIKNPDYLYGGDTMIEMKFITEERWDNASTIAFLKAYALRKNCISGQCMVSFADMTDMEKKDYAKIYENRLRSYLIKARRQTSVFKRIYPQYTKSILLLINTGCRGLPLDATPEWLSQINKSSNKPYVNGHWFINYSGQPFHECLVTGNYEGLVFPPKLRDALATLNATISDTLLCFPQMERSPNTEYIPMDTDLISTIGNIAFFWLPNNEALQARVLAAP